MNARVQSVAATLIILACGGGGGSATGTVPPVTTNPAPPTATNAVDVDDNVFTPEGVSVAAQSPVTWTWKGSAGHNVTFEDGQGSSATKSSGSHSKAFSAAGTYRYRCTIHSSSFTAGMVGAVVVK